MKKKKPDKYRSSPADLCGRPKGPKPLGTNQASREHCQKLFWWVGKVQGVDGPALAPLRISTILQNIYSSEE